MQVFWKSNIWKRYVDFYINVLFQILLFRITECKNRIVIRHKSLGWSFLSRHVRCRGVGWGELLKLSPNWVTSCSNSTLYWNSVETYQQKLCPWFSPSVMNRSFEDVIWRVSMGKGMFPKWWVVTPCSLGLTWCSTAVGCSRGPFCVMHG